MRFLSLLCGRNMIKSGLQNHFLYQNYLDKKVKSAHSDGLIDKVATLRALKPIRIVHQVWKIELREKDIENYVL